MRTQILEEIYRTMRRNPNTYFLTGDLGYNSLERFESDFKERFINMGVAEQNMMGVASGLAMSGKKVFIYSIIPFLIMRCYEQIRDDICFNDLDITLLGIGSGLTYGVLSRTHFALEDIAILRPLPNMSIFSPSDAIEASRGMRFFSTYKHPLYVRIAGREEPTINQSDYFFKFGKGVVLKKGKKIVIFSSGPIISEVTLACKLLKKRNNEQATLVNLPTVKPLDKDLIIEEVKRARIAFVVEEHGLIGGLGSAIAEVVSEESSETKLVRIGTRDEAIEAVGTRSYLRKRLGLDAEGIYKRILQKSEAYLHK